MTLTRRERVMITAGVIVVALAAYIFYFLIPTVQNTGDARIRLIQAQSKANQLNYMAEQAAKLEEEIKALDGQMAATAGSIPKGLDHARILQYLKELTDGKAEAPDIAMTAPPAKEGNFLLQAVTLQFRGSYADYIAVLTALKRNTLYSRATFVQAVYTPPKTEQPQPTDTPAPAQTGDATAEAAPTAAPETVAPARVVDDNVLTVHIELNFYALEPGKDEQTAGPLEPTLTDRGTALFPEE